MVLSLQNFLIIIQILKIKITNFNLGLSQTFYSKLLRLKEIAC